jgi:hypothetical protein
LYVWKLLEQVPNNITPLLTLWWIYRLLIWLPFGYWGFETALDVWRAIKYKKQLPLGQSIRQLESGIRYTVIKLKAIMIAWDWEKCRKGVGLGLHLGLIIGLLYGPMLGIFLGWGVGLILTLLITSIGGLFGGLLSQVISDDAYLPSETKITLGESIRLYLHRKEPDYLLMAVIFASIFSLFFGLFYGLMIGLGIAMVSALRIGYRPIDQTTYPGQKINLSIRTIFSAYLAIGFFGAMIFIVFTFLWGNPSTTLIGLLLLIMLFAALLGWFLLRGPAIFQHYCLRIVFAMNNYIPWDIIPFLNRCVDLIFLRRVGGGYIFVHRLLMEHFAAMHFENEESA